jgi:hypothetical protein
MTQSGEEMTMTGMMDVSQPIKEGAKLDPVLQALVRRMVEVAQQAKDFEHLGQREIRIRPNNLSPANPTCGCGCSCC